MRRIAVPLLALSTLTASVLLQAPVAQAADPAYAPVNGQFTLVGRGYGHGRGMSQWGAYQQATQGRTHQQILSFYFPRATQGTIANSTVRVSTFGHTGNFVRIIAEPGLSATDGAGQTRSLPTVDGTAPITSWEIALPASGGTATTTTLWFRTATARKALVSTNSGRWTISAADRTLQATNSAGKIVANYLGSMTGNRSGSTIVPVVSAPMEDYLRQVVSWEMYTNWPVQALAAQAVAARSYAAWHLKNPKSPYYDICDTVCQSFGGITNETANTKQGVAASAGRVMSYSGVPIRSEYSSSNGGQIAASGQPYTDVKADPYEMRLPASVTTWSGTVPVAKLQAKYPAVGTVQSLAVTGRDGKGQWGGRVTQLTLVGSKGKVNVRPVDLGALASTYKGAYFTLVPSVASFSRDWDSDGVGEFIARNNYGQLQLFAATSASTFAAPRLIGTGWYGMRHVAAGPFTNDRTTDVLAVDASNNLYVYPSRGGVWDSRILAATAVGAYNAWTIAPSNSSGAPQVLARRASDGALVAFTRTSGNKLSAPVVVTPSGWNGKAYNTMFAVRDFSGDGRDDLIVRQSNGDLMMFAGTGAGRFGAPTRIGTGWSGFQSISTAGDVTGDGRSDIIARTSNGATRMYTSNPRGGFGVVRTLSTVPGVLLS